MESMNSIFGFIGVILGVYAFRSWYQLKMTKDLSKSILLPKDINVKKCKDKEGYIKEASPNILILAVTATIYGAIELINAMVTPIPTILTISLVVSGIIIVYACVVSSKINKKYFPGL